MSSKLGPDILEVETLIIGDRYSFIRDSYMQYQDFESSDGENQVDDFVDDMDDFLARLAARLRSSDLLVCFS